MLESTEANKERLKRIGSRVWNYLYIRDVYRIQREHLGKWRQVSRWLGNVKNAFNKIAHSFQTRNKETAFSSISHHSFTKTIFLLHTEIDKITEQKKQLRLSLASMLQTNAEEVLANEKQISSLQNEIAILTKGRDTLLDNFFNRNQTQKTQNAYKNCFLSWKKLFTARKASIRKFEVLWWKYNTRRLFRNVQQTIQQEKTATDNQRYLRKVIMMWENRHLLAALRTWKSKGLAHQGNMEAQRNQVLETELTLKTENMKKYIDKNVTNLTIRRKVIFVRNVFNGWKQNWLKKKERMAKAQAAKQKLEYGIQRRIFLALKSRREYKKGLRAFEAKLKKSYTKTILNKYFRALVEFKKIPKQMEKKLVIYVERLKLLWRREAFEKISEYKITKEV